MRLHSENDVLVTRIGLPKCETRTPKSFRVQLLHPENSGGYCSTPKIYLLIQLVNLSRNSSHVRIPERDVTYIVLSIYLLTLIHRCPLHRKQFH